MAPDATNPVIGTITITVLEDRTIGIASEGVVDAQIIAIATFYLNRTANQIIDGQVFREAQRSDPSGLAIVRAMPDPAALRES